MKKFVYIEIFIKFNIYRLLTFNKFLSLIHSSAHSPIYLIFIHTSIHLFYYFIFNLFRFYVINAWVETSGNDQQTNLPKNKSVLFANNEKWFKSNAYEFFIKICKRMTMMINGVKHYVKNSINECIKNKIKNCLFAK